MNKYAKLFKFQSDSINTNALAGGNGNGSLFKFQSDSINTKHLQIDWQNIRL